jgi:hypothetical protein
MKDQKRTWSRRQFLNSGIAGIAGMMIIPKLASSSRSRVVADIKLGFIGMGQQSMFLLNGFLQIPGVKVIAGCDVYGVKRKRFEKRVTAFYTKAGKESKIETYEKFEDLLGRTDIDAVVIAVPDHSHARIAIAACKAGKDVYLEKPMTFTIKEGQELKKAVRQYNRILAIGSQQRSDPGFQHAVNLIQTGALGKISKVNAYVGAPPKPYNLTEEPIPADLNWDLWLGSLPIPIHFNSQLDPPIKIEPEQNENYGERGAGTRKWEADLPQTGVPTCLILLNGDSEWIKMALLKHLLLVMEQNICPLNMQMGLL